MKTTILSILGAILGMAATATSQAQTIVIDLGNSTYLTTSPGTWNSPIWDPVTTGTVVSDLLDNSGVSTGVSLSITDAFDGINAAGSTTSTILPMTATIDSWFTQGPGSEAVLSFSGLNPSLSYTFTLYASRAGVSNNRESRYTLAGLNSGYADLAVSNNVDMTVTISDITPTLSGIITLTMEAGPNNDADFSYLGSIQIAAVPEPATGMLVWLGGLSLLLRRRRRIA